MMRKVLETLLVSLVVVLVLGVYFRFVGGIPFNVNQTSTQKTSTFNVSGTGTKTVAPDEAIIELGIRKQAKTVKEAQRLGNTALDSLVKELGKLGVNEKDIKTVNYSVNPEYSPENYQKIIGFVVYANVEVTIKEGNFEKLEQVVDLAGTLGLEQLGGLRFKLSDEVEKKAREEARGLAVIEAKEKAVSLAKLAGVRLGKIVNISESTSGGPVPMYAMTEARPMLTGDAKVQTSVNPGTTNLQVMVTLSYETL